MCLYLHIKLFTVSKCTCLLWISIPKAKSFQFDTERFRTLKKRLEGPTYLCWNSLINMYKCTIYILFFFHMLLNVYIFHFAFWYEMIDSLCSSYSSSLAWKPWVYWVKNERPRARAPLHFLTISTDPFGQRYWWPNFSHVSEVHKKWFEYITNMSGKNTIVFLSSNLMFSCEIPKSRKKCRSSALHCQPNGL